MDSMRRLTNFEKKLNDFQFKYQFKQSIELKMILKVIFSYKYSETLIYIKMGLFVCNYRSTHLYYTNGFQCIVLPQN